MTLVNTTLQVKDLDSKISKCEGILGYTFKNRLLCLEALQTTGYAIEWHGPQKLRRNEFLATLGGLILETYLCRRWIESNRSKEDWTKIKESLTNATYLDQLAKKFDLVDCIIANPGATETATRTVATTVKALIGAVRQDSCEENALHVMWKFGFSHELLGEWVQLTNEEAGK